MEKLYFVTGREKFWGQFRKPWVTLTVQILEDELRAAGWEAVHCQFHDVACGKVKIKGSVVFYSFSQKSALREYYKDIVYSLKCLGNILLPTYELLLCHENKGYQELYKKALGIDSLWALYLSDGREIDEYEIKYPVVLKTLDGSNGRGVFLIHSEKELRSMIKKLTPALPVREKIDLLRRKHFRLKKQVKGWPEYEPHDDYWRYQEYIKPTRSFVLQEYIPDLEHDFRVLAVHDHYYITKRHVRKDDFRASGSKLFDFDTGDVQDILNYAKTVAAVFDMPYISLDIVKSKDKFHLLEFQASHFGTNVIKLSQGYYINKDGVWVFQKDTPDVSKVLAQGLVRYLEYKKY